MDQSRTAARTQDKRQGTAKKDNGKAFREIAVMNGVSKLPYKCTFYSDGCGSMVHVKDSAIKLGIDYVKIPPRDQSLNEAEKVCNFMWASARTHLIKTGAPLSLMPFAVSYSMYVDLRMATTASRDYLTPYEMIKGERPFIDHIRPFFTTSHVHVSKERRQKLKKLGLSTRRAEVGNLLGFDSPFSTTYSVLLDQNRLVRSRSVTFEIGSYNSMGHKVAAPPKSQNSSGQIELEVSLPSKGVLPIDSDEEDPGHISFSGNEASEDDDLEELFQNSPVIEIENEDFDAYDNPARAPGTPVTDCAPSGEEPTPESEGLNGGYTGTRLGFLHAQEIRIRSTFSWPKSGLSMT